MLYLMKYLLARNSKTVPTGYSTHPVVKSRRKLLELKSKKGFICYRNHEKVKTQVFNIG